MDYIRLFDNNSKFDSLVICSQVNRLYFTTYNATYGFVVLNQDKTIFITDSRYIEEARQNVPSNIDVVLVDSIDPYNSIKCALKRLDAHRVGLEGSSLPYNEYMELKGELLDFETVDASSDIDSFRAIKTDYEIEQIVKAQGITDIAYSNILKVIKPNVTEKDIAIELNYLMLKNGADDIAFDTIVASGVNTSKPHAHASMKKIERGDLVTMDFGAKFNNYCADMTRTVGVFNLSKELKTIYNIVLNAHNYALNNIKAGMTCREADSFAREYITAYGYRDYFTHSLGHGVGIEVHEQPNLTYRSNMILQENMVITIEPGIYIKNFGGVRIENMAVVKKDGLQNITKSNKELLTL